MMEEGQNPHFDHLIDLTKGAINRKIFSDPEIYQWELKNIFAKCWLFLGHESMLPKKNDFFSAYMGEDPVIVTRTGDGEIHAFLNMCRHRGNRVCRGGRGNARQFTCPFHGWSWRNDGKLNSVPGYKEVYLEKLDMESHGLVKVAQLTSYKGLIWATWDKNAPPLLEYLGDMAWYLDMAVDRREGGIEFLPGNHKWQVKCNWKLPVDNFIGDSYHGPVSHGSAWQSGFEGQPLRMPGYGREGFQVSPGSGHGFGVRWAESYDDIREMALPEFKDYETMRAPETHERLGDLRGLHMSPMHASIFPNTSMLWQAGSFRVWHPRGPLLTEAWSWCFVDKAADEKQRKEVRLHELQRHGTTGTWEQDDVDNWVQTTQASRGYTGRQFMQNLSMGVSDENPNPKEIHPEFRGRVGRFQSEINQRDFYREWAKRMNENSAPEIEGATAI